MIRYIGETYGIYDSSTYFKQESSSDSGLEDLEPNREQTRRVSRPFAPSSGHTSRSSFVSCSRPSSVGYHSRPLTGKYRQEGFERRLCLKSLEKSLEKISNEQTIHGFKTSESKTSISRPLSSASSSHYRNILSRFRPNTASRLWFHEKPKLTDKRNSFSATTISTGKRKATLAYAAPKKPTFSLEKITNIGPMRNIIHTTERASKTSENSHVTECIKQINCDNVDEIQITKSHPITNLKCRNKHMCGSELKTILHTQKAVAGSEFTSSSNRPSTCPVISRTGCTELLKQRPSSERLTQRRSRQHKHISFTEIVYKCPPVGKRIDFCSKSGKSTKSTNEKCLALTGRANSNSQSRFKKEELTARIFRIQRMKNYGIIGDATLAEILSSIRSEISIESHDEAQLEKSRCLEESHRFEFLESTLSALDLKGKQNYHFCTL